MIRINKKEYSGYIASTEEEKLTVIISTADVPADVLPMMRDVREIVEVSDGVETAYAVTAPIACKWLERRAYMMVWGTRPTQEQQMEELQGKLNEQSETIDALLVALLEG